jgi:UDP-N-acetylglucosamine acyltransferase
VQVGDGTSVGSHALLTGWTHIGKGCRIHHGAVLGSPPQDLKYGGEPSYLEVGEHTEVREYVTANLATEPGATTRIGSRCLLMAYAHVAHNCQIGDHVILANAVQMAGYVTIEDWAIVGGGSVIHQFVRIGRHAMVGGGSRIANDVAPYIKLAGSPPRLAGINAVGLERRGFGKPTRDALERAYRILFRDGLTVAESVTRMRAAFPDVPEVEILARFAETSARGLSR